MRFEGELILSGTFGIDELNAVRYTLFRAFLDKVYVVSL